MRTKVFHVMLILNMNTRAKTALRAGIIFLLASGLALGGITALWWQSIINLPPVAVRNIGRVASAVSRNPAMTVELPVAFHRQEHSLSCEIATLKMALQAVGVPVTESELIANLPFDRTPKSGGTWGDPNQGFVGSIDGKMLISGYGVYWDPIAKVGARYKRTEILRNATASQIAAHIKAGRPVIIWGYTGRYQAYRWLSSEGKPVQAVNGEHTRIVTGFSGTVTMPTGFKLIDPIYGPLTWSTDKFMENWTSLGRHAVVIYPHPRWIQSSSDNRIWELSADGTVRRWVKTWSAFEQRGGFAEAVSKINARELANIKRGPDIQ